MFKTIHWSLQVIIGTNAINMSEDYNMDLSTMKNKLFL